MNTPLLRFQARVISGSARGRTLGVPTLNLDLTDVPPDLQDGIFACRAVVDEISYPASMHYGARPTFNDTRSCEVHLIDHALPVAPESVDVEVVQWLRGVAKFPTPEALVKQMEEDIAQTRKLLS